MIKRTYLSQAVAAALFLAAGATNVAFALDEVEPNNSLLTAQRLFVTSSSLQVDGKIGETSPLATPVGDVDFFSFEAEEDDVLIVDIDKGMKPDEEMKPVDQRVRSVDTILAIFGPLPDVRRVAENLDMDRSKAPDDGSDDFRDARIVNFRATARGTYVVGVSSKPRSFIHGGGVLFPTDLRGNSNGSYKLIISGVTPLVQQISIEVKPGTDEDAPVNPKAKGNIPVALLSSKAFDALKVKAESITFGSTGDEKSWLRCQKEGVDINADGYKDLVCHFDNVAAEWQTDDVMGIVKGSTVDGRQFEGRGRLKIVPKHRD